VLKDAFPVWQAAQGRSNAIMGSDTRAKLDELLRSAEKMIAD
jgi:hypothetical protein